MVSKKYFLIMSLIIVMAIVGFVYAGDIVSIYINNQASSSVYNSNLLNRFFNFTVQAGTGDINQTNFSVSTGLSIVGGTNGTNAFGSMLNDSRNISWTNMTGDQTFLINTGTNKSFWFNITAAADGYYNVTVITWNVTDGVNKTNVTILFDTVVTNVIVATPENNSNSTQTGLNVNYTASDGNGVGLSACWYTNDTRSGNISLTNCGTNITTVTWAQGWHNVTIWANDTLNNINSTFVRFFIDNIPPAVTFVTPLNGTAISEGIYTLNATVIDAGVGTIRDFSVFFNITNLSSTVQNQTFTNATYAGNYYYNSTSFNASTYAEGMYIVKAIANDTLGNKNLVNSTIYIDRTVPSVITVTEMSAAVTTLNFNISITDAISGVNSACTINRSGTLVTPTGTGLFQNVSDISLTCNTAYVYNVSCSDRAGNLNSTTYSATTSACATASSSGGSAGSTATPSQLATGFTKTMYSGEVVSFKSENKSHLFILLRIRNDSADVQLSSAPIKATINLGEEKKFDLNEDGNYDIAVRLNSVIGTSKADITLRGISEAIASAGTTSDTNTDAAETGGEEQGETEAKMSRVWIWVLIIVAVIVIIAIITYFMKRK